MGIPLLFWIILGLLFIFAAVVAVYYLIYKRDLNRALRAGQRKRTAMAPPYQVSLAAALLILAAAVGISYFVGYKTAYDRMEGADLPPSQWEEQQTFYAEIREITGTPEEGNSVTVQGLSVNDINYRGTFSFAVFGETRIEWRGEPLGFEELEAGDTVSITFAGGIQESSPAVIEHVVRIQLLDDAK